MSTVAAGGPVPPTGKTITWDGVHFFVVREGRGSAVWAVADLFAKATQRRGLRPQASRPA
ncbi:hypothetical protein AB0B31_34995 [Catellatospora citrea]|uniref:hypothetical protein n=1 Tax=Catellatospora citrea TaxID=53366 RepID=UPI0033F66EEE